MSNLEEKTIKSESIYTGKIISLQVDDVELPNGKQGKRELIKHPGAVAVLAVTDDQKIIMVEQYRKALEKTIVEIPAGKLEQGEDPEVCAKRELEEETGYEAAEWSLLTSFYTSPGFADEIVHLYIAKGLTKKENSAALDEDEFVNLMELTLSEAEQLVNDQRIHDAKTAYAVLYFKLQEVMKSSK